MSRTGATGKFTTINMGDRSGIGMVEMISSVHDIEGCKKLLPAIAQFIGVQPVLLINQDPVFYLVIGIDQDWFIGAVSRLEQGWVLDDAISEIASAIAVSPIPSTIHQSSLWNLIKESIKNDNTEATETQQQERSSGSGDGGGDAEAKGAQA